MLQLLEWFVDGSDVLVVEASFNNADGDIPGGTEVIADRCDIFPAVALVESPSGPPTFLGMGHCSGEIKSLPVNG